MTLSLIAEGSDGENVSAEECALDQISTCCDSLEGARVGDIVEILQRLGWQSLAAKVLFCGTPKRLSEEELQSLGIHYISFESQRIISVQMERNKNAIVTELRKIFLNEDLKIRAVALETTFQRFCNKEECACGCY